MSQDSVCKKISHVQSKDLNLISWHLFSTGTWNGKFTISPAAEEISKFFSEYRVHPGVNKRIYYVGQVEEKQAEKFNTSRHRRNEFEAP